MNNPHIIDPDFEAFVLAELGDVAVSDNGKYISPKIQAYYKIWQAVSETNRSDLEKLRVLLCVATCSTPYLDDGEASDCSVSPHIDFKRDKVNVIADKLKARSLAKLQAQVSAPAGYSPELLRAWLLKRANDSYTCRILVRDLLEHLEKSACLDRNSQG